MALANPRAPERLLVVEGPDDRHVICHIVKRCTQLPDFEIEDRGSVEKLVASIGADLKAPGRRVLGIVVDADDSVEDRWRSVTDRLRKAGVSVGNPKPGGTIIGELDLLPRVGVWIMPDNRSPGELEDFIQTMIPSDDSVWPLSRRYIEGIPGEERLFSDKKESRAKVHAWLAARERPRLMGAAIGAHDLLVDQEPCQSLVAWLRRLFG